MLKSVCVYGTNRKQESILPHDIPFQLRKPLASMKHPINEMLLRSLHFKLFLSLISIYSMSPRKNIDWPYTCRVYLLFVSETGGKQYTLIGARCVIVVEMGNSSGK